MKYNFDEIVDRRGTYTTKWDGRDWLLSLGMTERYDDDTIPLYSADMDIACAPKIVEALHAAADHRIFGYSLIPPEYKKAIIDWFKRRLDWQINEDEIVYNAGTVPALSTCVKAFTQPSDSIIVQLPAYPAFASATRNNGRKMLNNALVNNNGYYTIDFEDFEEKAKQRETTLFFLCSPHNPTGRVFTRDELKRLSDICAANGVIIVADEIHGDLIRQSETFYPIATVSESDKHIVSCTGINKTFNTAGLHCSNLVITDKALRRKYLRERGHEVPTPFAISALIAAYNESEDWLDELKVYLDGTLKWIDEFLKERMPKVKMFVPEGTYIIWMDFRGYGISDKEVHDRIYSEANVLLEDGFLFGAGGDGFQRMCIPAPRAVIKEAFERIAGAFADLG
ncbi:MAG: pyridoxal phosphate-dependent aminotransferase [Clostridia bacterium]|jgi:cysteine-S-conjugate beta-lyase|nr:pyridoxal phosphate-dependent aminotransferase [Clostridia bacterium]MBT7122314.1 pyridoxal phosphate-dependent aminotransferase [Clostridia bacterium]